MVNHLADLAAGQKIKVIKKFIDFDRNNPSALDVFLHLTAMIISRMMVGTHSSLKRGGYD
jgi:hypothetical protein